MIEMRKRELKHKFIQFIGFEMQNERIMYVIYSSSPIKIGQFLSISVFSMSGVPYNKLGEPSAPPPQNPYYDEPQQPVQAKYPVS